MTANDFVRIMHLIPILLLLMIACSSDCPSVNDDISKTNDFPIDTLATPETVALFRNLRVFPVKGYCLAIRTPRRTVLTGGQNLGDVM